MKSGIPISRHCVITLKTSEVVVDWGNGVFQDIRTGELLPEDDQNVSHTSLDEELNVLRKMGLVEKYDVHNVYIIQMPEPPKRTIE
jgi:hypothetical protein